MRVRVHFNIFNRLNVIKADSRTMLVGLVDRSNRKIVLAHRPKALPKLSDFALEEETVDMPSTGEVLIQVDTLSIDAFIRTSLNESGYHTPVPIGGTVSALGVGRVLESAYSDFNADDAVFGPLGAQTLAKVLGPLVRKVDEKRAPISAYLGALGLTSGLTSYFGIRDVGRVKEGDTVVVSAAAGGVGSIAVQLARIEGAVVIGIAGGQQKVRYVVDELGAKACIDYKSEDVGSRLRQLAPHGVDVYFDNVGGELLDLLLDQISEGARIVICGAISQYQQMDQVRGPSLYLRLAERGACMEGFAVTHFADRFAEQIAHQVSCRFDNPSSHYHLINLCPKGDA